MIAAMDDAAGTAEIDEILRALVRGGDMTAIPELLVRGRPAFERFLQLKSGELRLGVETDQRDEEPAMNGALNAFARQDIESVLSAVLARGFGETAGAVSAIGEVAHPCVVSFLLRAVASKHPSVRASAVRGLSRQRDPRVLDAMVLALSDRSSEVRECAIEALGELGDPGALEPLRRVTEKAGAKHPYVQRLLGESMKKIRAAARRGEGPSVLDQAVNACFSAAKRKAAAGILAEYEGPERERVQLGVLALTAGSSLEALASHVAAARRDYRDVLKQAEAPGGSRRLRLERVARYWAMSVAVPSSLLEPFE